MGMISFKQPAIPYTASKRDNHSAAYYLKMLPALFISYLIYVKPNKK